MQATFSSYRHSFVLLILMALLFSCKKEKESSPEEPAAVSISISADQLKGYEICVLTVSNFTLTKANYELDFGGKKITSVKNVNNSLSFLTPGDLASGTYTIKAGFVANSISVAVTAPETISDPGVYVTDLVGNTSQSVQDYLDISGESTVPTLLSDAKTNLDQALADFNAIPLADQQILAQILKANEVFFIESEQLIADFKGVQANLPNVRTTGDNWAFSDCSNDKCKIAYSIGKVGAVLLLAKASAVLGTAAALIAGIDIALSIMTNKRSIMLGAVLAIAKTAFDLAYFAPNYTTEAWLDAFDNTITSGMRVAATSTMNILKEEPFTFKPNIEFSTLKPSLNTENVVVINAIASIENGKSFYTNVLGSPAGPFPDYQNITESKKINAVSELEITVLDNPSVTMSAPVGTAEEFTVVFNTNLSTDQTFTLSVKYLGEFETTTRTFPVKLVSQDLLIGEWVATLADGITLGVMTNQYSEERCPTTRTGSERLNSYSLKITSDSVINIMSSTWTYGYSTAPQGQSIDCANDIVVNEGLNTQSGTYEYAYTRNGNILSIYDQNGTAVIEIIQLDEGQLNLKYISGDGDVLEYEELQMTRVD